MMFSTMRRGFGLRASIALLAVMVGALASANAALAGVNWSQFRFGAARTGFNPFEVALGVSNVSKLRARSLAIVGGPIQSAPAIVNGVAFVFVTDGRLYALRLSDGKRLWVQRVGRALKPTEFHTSSPAVSGGRVFVGTYGGKLVAVRASDGHPVWSRSTGGAIKSSPAVADGVVFIGSNDRHIYAFRASDGKRLWRSATGGVVSSSPAVVDGTVYVGSADRNVYALRARDGARRWTQSTGGAVAASPAVGGTSLYVASQNGKLYALASSTGAVKWTAVYMPKFRSDVGHSPAVAGGLVFTTGVDTSIRAFNATTGHQVWRKGPLMEGLSDPAVANGVVYIGSTEDRLLAFTASTGTKLFGASGQQGFAYFDAVVANGKVFLGSNDSKLHVYELPAQPRLKLRPTVVPAGGRLTFIGSGFRPDESVWLAVGPPQSEALHWGSARTDHAGTFRKTFTVNPRVKPGRWVAIACQRGCRTKASASFRTVSRRG